VVAKEIDEKEENLVECSNMCLEESGSAVKVRNHLLHTTPL
jgi:hypothetical protein